MNNLKFYFLLGTITLAGCTKVTPEAEFTPLEKPLLELTEINTFAGKGEYQHKGLDYVTLTIKNHTPDIEAIPRAYLQGYSFQDLGIGADEVAGDGIYTSASPIQPKGSAQAEFGFPFSLSCKFYTAYPGQECSGEPTGMCPDKSWLGGDTWICFCFKDCEFCVGSACQSE